MLLKKYFILVIIIVSGIKSHSQTKSSSYFDLDIKSKYGTEVKISLSVYHESDYEFDKNSTLISEINSKIIDSLKLFDAIEMYTTAIDKIGPVAGHFYKKNFAKNNIKFYDLYLLNLEIPHELEVLYERQIKISQKYLETFIIIENKKDSLNKIIQTKSIDKRTKRQTKKELKILENSEYFRKIYDAEVLKLMLNSQIN